MTGNDTAGKRKEDSLIGFFCNRPSDLRSGYDVRQPRPTLSFQLLSLFNPFYFVALHSRSTFARIEPLNRHRSQAQLKHRELK